ncbi:MAG: flagellar basal-body MS-ring/collar protein FliF [Nocardioides sp.]
MRHQITGRLQQLQRTFATFTTGQKTVAVIGGLALLLAAGMAFRWASTPAYAPLFTNIAPADASAVIDQLESQGTPYKLAGGGSTILVPQADVYDARIQLSGEGLPSQSSDGYSILDKQSLSTSQFQEETSYKRAIEGELESTIEALDAVQTAVVHVAMPQETLFETDKAPTTASVLVQTRPGSTLGVGQVQAIVHLVASSVEGLDPKQVTVTDSAGQVLSAAGDDAGTFGDTRAQQVQAFEDRMGGSVTSVLDRVLGAGNSAVQVTADLNFDQTTTQTTRYFTDPKLVPLTDTKLTEKYTAPGNSTNGGGVVGPDGQLDPNAVPNGATAYEKKQRTADNAVNQSVEHREAAPGNVESLHVGVVVDTQALGARDLADVQALVTSALGIDPQRGDTVEVTTMPFDRSGEAEAKAALAAAKKADDKAQMMSMAKTGGLVLLLLLVLLAAWRQSRKRTQLREQATTYVVEQIRRNSPAVEPAPVAAAELPTGELADLKLAARDEIASMVERQPEDVAQLLRGWLVEAE